MSQAHLSADRVEVKAIVPEAAQAALVSAVLPHSIRRRRLYYFDSRGLALHRNGVIVRARLLAPGLGDSVIKLRGSRPARLPGRLRRCARVEVDALPGHFCWSTAIKQRVDPSMVRAVARGRRPLTALLSGEQRALLRTCDAAPAPGRLILHGPIRVERSSIDIVGRLGATMVETWIYPDGIRRIEVSTKCHPRHAQRVASRTKQFLSHHGVVPVSRVKTKSRRALRFPRT